MSTLQEALREYLSKKTTPPKGEQGDRSGHQTQPPAEPLTTQQRVAREMMRRSEAARRIAV
jgi:hypothetical protein